MPTIEERLDDIKKNPNLHRHDFDGLQRCCMTPSGIDLRLLDAHQEYAPMGENGGRRCDVNKGVCSCGAWH